MDILIGHTIDQYKIVEKIGQGGMAEVYKGYHLALKRYVAIKLLGRTLRDDPVFTNRFQREAQASASLRHANIIRIFDYGAFEGGHYIVMEYIEGTDLRAEMDRRKREYRGFTPGEVLHILSQVAEALDYAHQQGVIHRDVKPANILLSSEGQVVLSDFGLAMLRNRVSQVTMGHSFGTPEYIAPEQAIDSRAAVPQSDIYALGAILYEIVAGRPPFYAESPLSLALMHVNEDPTPPRQYAPSLPETVEAVILRALAKDPEERFPTARAMVDALRRAWAGQDMADQDKITQPAMPVGRRLPPTPPPPPSSPPPSPTQIGLQEPAPAPAPWWRGWPMGVGIIGALLLIPALLIGVSALFPPEEPMAVVSTETAAFTRTPPSARVPTDTLVPTKVPTDVPTLTSTHTPVSTLVFTPTPTGTPTPTDTPSPTPTATWTPAPSPVILPTATPTATPLPTETPTATPTVPPAPTETTEAGLLPGQVAVRSVDGMAMRFVPAGSFLMGTDDTTEAYPQERPQHTVILSAYWIDETEVTNAQYQLCVEAKACEPPSIRTYYDDPARANHPVVYVTWAKAGAYCNWLADEMGWDIHLPTEAQWEKAASWAPVAEVKYRFPWGDTAADPTLLNYQGSGLGRTTSVGSYPLGASPYGALDMAGNVWEWVSDWYGYDYYDEAEGAVDPLGPATGTHHVMRGGSYGYDDHKARTTHRDAGTPRASGAGLGFRCVVSGESLE
ncbi:MAG: SUMF1/EgtB/PvdO family nonheme iron enzyme [Anaerolineae bacterium]|nr:SUMF1/EgtB/PvdO family nonheme iron enzyme [Anaerolineae bacterium]